MTTEESSRNKGGGARHDTIQQEQEEEEWQGPTAKNSHSNTLYYIPRVLSL